MAPDWPEAHYWLSVALDREGRLDEATTAARAAAGSSTPRTSSTNTVSRWRAHARRLRGRADRSPTLSGDRSGACEREVHGGLRAPDDWCDQVHRRGLTSAIWPNGPMTSKPASISRSRGSPSGDATTPSRICGRSSNNIRRSVGRTVPGDLRRGGARCRSGRQPRRSSASTMRPSPPTTRATIAAPWSFSVWSRPCIRGTGSALPQGVRPPDAGPARGIGDRVSRISGFAPRQPAGPLQHGARAHRPGTLPRGGGSSGTDASATTRLRRSERIASLPGVRSPSRSAGVPSLHRWMDEPRMRANNSNEEGDR